jgi:predicted metal-dependent peptidase
MKLLIEQPYYGYIASSVSFAESEKIDTIQMASLPKLVITYNPVWFSRLKDVQKLGVILHELIHVILLHQFRIGNREILLWSVACDMAVNEMIPVINLPDTAVTVERIESKLKRKIEHNRNAEYYYEQITDMDDLLGFSYIEGDSILIFEGEDSLKVQKLSEETASDMEINALKSNMAQSLSEAQSDAEAYAGMDERIEEIYRDIQMDWRVILKRFLTGRGRMITRKSYKRQSRRYEELPGTKRSVGVDALIAIDESGSISDSLVNEFYRELREINKITGTNMMVTRFDTECTEPVPLSTFAVTSKRMKRGGTDFRPVFGLADRYKIPLVIIFTDGDGDAPASANQNTLWVLTKNAKKPANFGYFLSFGGD